MDAFESPLFLVNQTRKNLANLDAVCQSFFQVNRGRRVTDVDPKTGNKTFKIVFDGTLPTETRHIAASAINDLRHALDQAACATFQSLTNTEPGLLYFPIANNPNDLDGRLKKHFPPEIWDTFRKFKPYPTGQGYNGGNDAICALSKAAQSKHRVSCKIGGLVQSIGGGKGGVIRASAAKWGRFGLVPEWDILKNEMILATTGPDGDLHYDVDITFQIALYDAGPLTGHPAVGALNHITDVVGGIVSMLREETARILASRV